MIPGWLLIPIFVIGVLIGRSKRAMTALAEAHAAARSTAETSVNVDVDQNVVLVPQADGTYRTLEAGRAAFAADGVASSDVFDRNGRRIAARRLEERETDSWDWFLDSEQPEQVER